MSSSSSSASTIIRKPKLFKVDLEGNVYCFHDTVVVIRAAGAKSVRQGQQFYGGLHWPRSDCKFFLRKEDVDKMFKEHSNGNLTPTCYEDLKIQNLELQNLVLVEENKILKAKICVTESKLKSKKTYVLTLLIATAIWLYLYS